MGKELDTRGFMFTSLLRLYIDHNTGFVKRQLLSRVFRPIFHFLFAPGSNSDAFYETERAIVPG